MWIVDCRSSNSVSLLLVARSLVDASNMSRTHISKLAWRVNSSVFRGSSSAPLVIRSLSTGSESGATTGQLATSGSNPTTLHKGPVTIHLLGTMHIANASATAAHRLIQDVHATGNLRQIFLELDQGRLEVLRKGGDTSYDDVSTSSMLQSLLAAFTQGASGKGGMDSLASMLRTTLKGVYRTLHRVGFASGVEFHAALNAAEKLNVPVVTGDIEVSQTMSSLARAVTNDVSPSTLFRAMTSGGMMQHARNDVERAVMDAFSYMASGDSNAAQARLSQVLDRDSVRDIIASTRELAPNVCKALLDDRDEFMALGLYTMAKDLERRFRTPSVVAIVGLAHVDGIEQRWQRLVHQDALR